MLEQFGLGSPAPANGRRSPSYQLRIRSTSGQERLDLARKRRTRLLLESFRTAKHGFDLRLCRLVESRFGGFTGKNELDFSVWNTAT